MTCEHRNVTAIPGGRYACADTLNCCATFAISTDRVSADDLRVQLDVACAGRARSERSVTRLLRQRDSARDCAVILEQLLAEADDDAKTLRRRLQAECDHKQMSQTGVDQEWGPGKIWECDNCMARNTALGLGLYGSGEATDACPAGSVHQWRRFKDGEGGHTKCLRCGIRRVEDGTP